MRLRSLILCALLLVVSQRIRECESQNIITLTASAATYTGTAGSSLTMTFLANHLQPSTNIEVFFSSDGSQGSNSIVYASGSLVNSRFSVPTPTTVDSTTTRYSITLSSVATSDASFTLYVRCAESGVYTSGGVCSSSNAAYLASSRITSVSTTTVTTTTASSATGANGRPVKNTVCIEGAYLPAQYCLLLLTYLVLLIASGLYYFPFYDEPTCHVKINESNAFLRRFNLLEFMIFISVTMLTLVIVVIGIIFWINGDLIYDPNYVSLVIIILDLLACFILWLLIIQYCIRLVIKKRVKFYVLIFVGVLAFCELFFAFLLFFANIYCTGYSLLPALTNSNYSYVQVIAAVFLFVFALLLLLVFGVVYYFLQKTKSLRRSDPDFDNLKPASSGSTSSRIKDATTSSKVAPNDAADKKKQQELDEKKRKEDEMKQKELEEKKKKKKEEEEAAAKNKKTKATESSDKPAADESKSNTRPMMSQDPFSSIWNADDPFAPNAFSGNRDNRAKDLTGARKVKSQEEKNLFSTNVANDSYLDLFNNSFNNFAKEPTKSEKAPKPKSKKKAQKTKQAAEDRLSGDKI